MNLRKLRIDKFEHIQAVNFPKKYNLGIQTVDSGAQVIIFYIDSVEDIKRFMEHNSNVNLPEDNRTIIMYEKGRKDGVNRDSIMLPFKDGQYPEYRLKNPMLCSISEQLSAVVLKKIVS